MIKNFFKIAYRNLWRSKGFSVINVTGLAIGMAAAILIILWIQNELSFDGFHVNKDRIYQVWSRATYNGETGTSNHVSAPLARAAEKEVSEIERAVRAKRISGLLFSVGEKKLTLSGGLVDTGFLQMFTYPMLKGDPKTALNDAHSIVLTQKMAQSLFGDEDPMGKTVKVDNKDNMLVTGVLKDMPYNTRFYYDYLVPWSYIKVEKAQDLGWNDNSEPTFVMLKKNTGFASASAKLRPLREHYNSDAKQLHWEYFLYPMERWRLYSSFTNGVEDGNGRSKTVNLFGIIALFILLIACINFMNLSTARSEKRAKEVGIRKVVGARKASLIGQFIGESVFMALLAGIIAVIIVLVSLPAYNRFTENELYINFGSIYTWLTFFGFILFTGVLAGSYPAFFLSSFQPVKVLKGTFKKINALVTPRKALVVVQFTFAIVLIICTIVIKQQIDYARNRETGYNRDHVVYHFMTGDIPKNYDLIKNELLSQGVATSVTKTNSPITERWSDGGGQMWEGKDPNDRTSFARYLADEGLGKTVGLQFVKGRDFDLKQYPTDSSGLIVNESALRVLKFKDPIGKKVSDLGVDWHIVGVIKDFILTSPYEPIQPLLICGAKSSFLTFNIVQMKFNGKNSTADNLKRAETIFKKYNPQYPFDFKFVDEEYAKKFEDEQRLGTMAALFAGLAIFISCLGLFGLAAYMAENRIKEIGVRKVLGASVARITTLLSKELIALVIISFIIAAPIAYWGMSKWLLDYSYRVSINWWVFALAGTLSIIIALITVSYQAIKAALANPVKNLRAE
ncbi:FtsX-like permease family protein [Mucilaginibacter corticis]|uniref:FtsX-like permease family protein n=1 Tax=Mucilaginibacter corticis TaxID=2597670 RepID=A0A556MKZ7_9SPHI|nr:ABC transporter permease [Mucilaginibacter corticis]TSJ40590.1 FtsX-like permease family protein [Mucilaginibacter corticis]